MLQDLGIAKSTYQTMKDRILALDPQIDERALADTLEGLTDIHEILASVIRSALDDEYLAAGLKLRLEELEGRLNRFEERANKRRGFVRDAMVELGFEKLQAPDFVASVRKGTPKVTITDEAKIPLTYWEQRPQLRKQEILADLKAGTVIEGAALSNPEPVLMVRAK